MEMNVTQLSRRFVPRTVRNWLRRPGRTARYVAQQVAYYLGYAPSLTIDAQWQLRCHPISRDHFDVFSTDASQVAELSGFVSHCRPGMVLLDVGAHYGFFSLAALHYGGPDARVVAVEASDKAARVLRINLALSGVLQRAVIVEAAAGGSDGRLAVLTTGPAAGDYVAVPAEPRPDVRYVPMKSLNSIVNQAGVLPTHVKIDVEGFEEEVLRGGEEVLARAKPILFLELHGPLIRARHKEPQTVLDLLEAFGYRQFELDGKTVERRVIEECNFDCRLVCTAPAV